VITSENLFFRDLHFDNRHHYKMSAVAHQCPVIIYISQLVIVGVFLSVESRKTGEFVALKAQDGSNLCATSSPDDSRTVRSTLDCYRSCVTAGCMCASGANYRKNDKLCEMYSEQPTNYQIVPDCTFYEVWLSSVFIAYIPLGPQTTKTCTRGT